jgi:hypothetical protein
MVKAFVWGVGAVYGAVSIALALLVTAWIGFRRLLPWLPILTVGFSFVWLVWYYALEGRLNHPDPSVRQARASDDCRELYHCRQHITAAGSVFEDCVKECVEGYERRYHRLRGKVTE